MDKWTLSPSHLSGQIRIPPSKSQTLRALLFASLASGSSFVENLLSSPDTNAMICAMRMLGAKISLRKNKAKILGFAGRPSPPSDVIYCGNSGLTYRFVAALASLIPHYTILTGDESIRHSRPIAPLLHALTELGAFAVSAQNNDSAPVIIRGPLTRDLARFDGSDSQPTSGLLISCSFAPHPITLQIDRPGETPWIDLTLNWLARLGVQYTATPHSSYTLSGRSQISSFSYSVPGDWSSALFPIVAALITRSELTIENVDFDDPQGDKKTLLILEKMGARFSYDPSKKSLFVYKSASLRGCRFDVNPFIDSLPILSVLGCFAEGKTEIVNGSIARRKESDRVSTIVSCLRKMGARIEEKEDGLVVYPSQLYGTSLNSHNDHRIALSLAVASLAASTPSCIDGVACVSKSYSSFFADFCRIGARIT